MYTIRAGVEAGGPMRGLTWVRQARPVRVLYEWGRCAGVAGAWFLLTRFCVMDVRNRRIKCVTKNA